MLKLTLGSGEIIWVNPRYVLSVESRNSADTEATVALTNGVIFVKERAEWIVTEINDLFYTH